MRYKLLGAPMLEHPVMASPLLSILLLAYFVLTVLSFPVLNVSSTCEKTQVAILGAGVAGITAAVCKLFCH